MNMLQNSKFVARIFSVLLALALTLTQVTPEFADQGDTTLVSVDSSGAQGNNTSYAPSISGDGRYVSFESDATNLVSGDTNEKLDIFVRDTMTNNTTRVSVDSSGAQANNESCNSSISNNGRVAFLSLANNLVAGDANGYYDIFMHDSVANTTTLISVDSLGVQGNSASGWYSSISADGRYVAFESVASNLVSGDTNFAQDIFVRDTLNNTTSRISVDSSGAQGNNTSYAPSISSDGRYVAFESIATNLVSGDTNGMSDVFVRDTVNNTTSRVSVDSSGAEGNNISYSPSISGDGHYVAFESAATNLVSGDTNGKRDIFVRDTLNNTTSRVSVDSNGVQGNDSSDHPSISSDGSYVAFESSATNLVKGDTATLDIFIYDTQTSITTRASVNNLSGVQGNGSSDNPSISSDGSYVAFESSATNLVSVDTNNDWDIFVHENDFIPPGVSSSVRFNPNPTNRASVNFTVTFSEVVTGVGTADFSLSKTGEISGESITGVSGTGTTRTVTISTGTGNGSLKLIVPANDTITDMAGNPLSGLPYTGGQTYTVNKTLTLRSVGAQDGWILESSETSNAGGSLNTAATTLFLGDNAAKKQYRSILSFSTKGLPDNAVITKVTLRVKKLGIIGGGNPVTTFQGFMTDIKKGTLGTVALQPTDFQAVANKIIGPTNPALVGGWYSLNLTTGKAYINKLATNGGLTQVRLRFKLDDNNNTLANYLSLYSGNAPIASRPQLIIEYYVP